MLESNDFVRCLFVDVSKAFDSINHALLFEKLSKLPLQSNVLAWIMNFLSGRTQAVCHDGVMSDFIEISQSIVQGSGVGPVLFIIYASDLRTLSVQNVVIKFADDTTLISPACSDVDISQEFDHLYSWSLQNKLAVNISKTKELIFRRPRLSLLVLPPKIPFIERVEVFKLLGVLFSSKNSMNEHVNFILSVVNQRFYLLAQLKKQGLSMPALNAIFQALVMSRIKYALPSFAGFLSATNCSRINAILKKARRWGITDLCFDSHDIIHSMDCDTFKRMQASDHCLHYLLPPINSILDMHGLRPRGHSFTLPSYKKALFKNSFIMRALYNLR